MNIRSLITLVLLGALAACTEFDAHSSGAKADHKVAVGGSCEQSSLPLHDAGDEETPFFQPADIQPVDDLEPLLGSALLRESVSLNGSWNYIVDQARLGDVSPLLDGGVGRNQRHGKSELLEYSFDGGHTMQVPGDWNTQVRELFWYRDVVWLQKEFDYSKPAGKRVWLYFGGANFKKDVYVNGKLLARHKGGFTPFNIDVTDYLVDGGNSVVVKVDATSGPSEVPTEYNDWMNYGGITREVMLVALPQTFVRNYKVQLKKGTLDTVSGWVQLDGEAVTGVAVTVNIPEAGIAHRVVTDAAGRAAFEFPATLQHWSPEQPKRYAVSVATATDQIEDQIGFRSIETRGEDILLNGKPIFLRGISMHEESLRRPGRAWGPEDAAAAISELKALNANFVRLAHYPHNEYMVRAADEAGVLVWAEMPVYHNIDFANPCTLASAKDQYRDLVSRDHNRAAVILWSLANETPNSEARNAFLRDLAVHVRGMDDTRLLTAALLGFGGMEDIGAYIGRKIAAKHSKVAAMLPDPKPVTITIDDPLGEVVDVIGYNEYLGWYMSGFIARGMRDKGLEVSEAEVRDLLLEEMHKFRLDTAFGKPLVISEFGAGAKKGYVGDELAVFSETYQARVYRKQLEFLKQSTALRGMSPWILKDFRAPYRLHTKIQDYWNRKGLVSETGERKLAFDVLADFYARESVAGR